MSATAYSHDGSRRFAIVAVVTALIGLLLLLTPLGEGWRAASFDYLFRFGARSVTNELVLVLMDNEAHLQLLQTRGQWNRELHASFLNRLAADNCPLVIFDVFFDEPREGSGDATLADSMRRVSNVVLMAEQAEVELQPKVAHPGFDSWHPTLPHDQFLEAAKTNWGVAWLDPDLDGIVRRHWPFPSSPHEPSLSWAAAQRAKASMDSEPRERWLRYYAPNSWTTLSYHIALAKPAGYFQHKTVLIGNKPKDSLANGETDEFRTPHNAWTALSVGGVEILATEFLNLLNHEWLRRAPPWLEWLVLVITGSLLGLLVKTRRTRACLLAVATSLLVLMGGVCLSYFSNFWFPWLIVAGGQVPLALAFALVRRSPSVATRVSTVMIPVVGHSAAPMPALDAPVEVPDFELVEPPFGKGAYGQVWLARNAVGQWQAIKMIFRAKFGEDSAPYEREFRGIECYKRVADKHPGLLRIDFVSRMKPQGYFYYAMELGDAAELDWERQPAGYKPLDLAAKCSANGGRLPARECLRICAKLCEPLQFLHEQGLAHRDIKPRNIIFVNGQPKLADVGLVTDAYRPAQEISLVGTPGFMPPEPEPPGTPQADIYALGMMLYVISTGSKPAAYPELSTTLVDRERQPEFSRLSHIIFKACHHDRNLRYASATEMRAALAELDAVLARESASQGA